MDKFQSLVTVMPWTFITAICNLFILAAALKHFLFKPVQNVLNKRAQEVETTYQEAEQARESAQAMQTEYKAKLQSAYEEAGNIVRTASERAEAHSQELLEQARNEVAAMKQKAEREIADDRKKAAGELKNDISALALDIAGKVVEKELDAKAHDELIREFIDKVGDVS